ncbi:MAG: glycosyltransferase family 2 protein [Eubacterium sp.]|nr:glycosyltransferase family 2 protein [Eubacterium sp.]
MLPVTVVIPNMNGKHFLEDCLAALKGQTMKEFGIIVVDNGSTDGSLEFLKRNYPEVKVISWPENLGFCKAVNAGIQASDSEYVILLNNDTVPHKKFVEALYRGIEKRPKAFCCTARMLIASNPKLTDAAGDWYSAMGWAFARGKNRPASDYKKPARVFSGCAGAAIYRMEYLEKTGLFDEAHFAYLEDLDICWRANILGYENWFLSAARVKHVGSGTSGSAHNPFKVRYSARNNVYVIYKNMPLPQRILNAPFLFAGFQIKKLYFKKKGLGKEYKEGLKEGKLLAKSGEAAEKIRHFEFRYFRNYCRIQLSLWASLFRRRG